MLKSQDFRQLLVMILKELEGAESLVRGDVVSPHSMLKGTRLTSLSELFRAAVANSPAARSCSSLAATGLDLRVSKTAFRACVWAWRIKSDIGDDGQQWRCALPK